MTQRDRDLVLSIYENRYIDILRTNLLLSAARRGLPAPTNLTGQFSGSKHSTLSQSVCLSVCTAYESEGLTLAGFAFFCLSIICILSFFLSFIVWRKVYTAERTREPTREERDIK